MSPGTTVTTRTPWRVDSAPSASGPAAQRELRRVVRGEVRDPHLAADRGDVHDRPAPALPHPGQHRLGLLSAPQNITSMARR